METPEKKPKSNVVSNVLFYGFIVVGLIVLIVIISFYYYTHTQKYLLEKHIKSNSSGMKKLEGDPLPSKIKWFADAKLGLFVHYGVYSQIGSDSAEWHLELAKPLVTDYFKNALTFNPSNFSAKYYVDHMKKFGLKYVCITLRHHDGFTLYNQNVANSTPNWNSGASKAGTRDFIMELKKEVEANGLYFCIYHTIMDWTHKDYAVRRSYNNAYTTQPNMRNFVNYLKDSVKDSLTRYTPKMIWFDGGWESCWTADYGKELRDMIDAMKIGVIYNDRTSPNAGLSHSIRLTAEGDFQTPERIQPTTDVPREIYWETCETIGKKWGYWTEDEKASNLKSAFQILTIAVNSLTNNGNFLINIGPKGDGTFPAGMVTVGTQCGGFINAHEEAIFGTRKGMSMSKTYPGKSCFKFTDKEKGINNSSMFVFVANNDWESNCTKNYSLEIPYNVVTNVSLVKTKKTVSFKQKLNTLEILNLGPCPDVYFGVIRIDFKDPFLYVKDS
ncbi:alpha-L-fucosidase [Carp edema virus]|nr:alpha-L-fucosidase [Carp edema virus]